MFLLFGQYLHGKKKIFSNDRFGIKNKGVPHYLHGMRNALTLLFCLRSESHGYDMLAGWDLILREARVAAA